MCDFDLHSHGLCTIRKGKSPWVRPDSAYKYPDMCYDLYFNSGNKDAHIKYQSKDKIKYLNSLINARCMAKVLSVSPLSDGRILLFVRDLIEKPADTECVDAGSSLRPNPCGLNKCEIKFLKQLKSRILHQKCSVEDAVNFMPILTFIDKHINKLRGED